MRHEVGLITSSVCEYCFSDRACDHGSGANPAAGCACSLAGTKRCPECGCECASWDWGLGFVGPASIQSFFGVGGDENPGFSGYPASKGQILAAAREELEEGDPHDVEWLSRNLPDGTYSERGDALAALSAVLSWSGEESSALLEALPMSAIAVGTRLRVGPDQQVALVGKTGHGLDRFGPGTYVISRESAPLAAAESRPAASGFSKSVITARPFFASTRETTVPFERAGRSRTGAPVQVRGTVTLAFASLPEFLSRTGARLRSISAAEMTPAVTTVLGPALDQLFTSHDPSELGGPGGPVEGAVRAAATQAGLRVSSVTLGQAGAVALPDQLAAMHERQREAMAHLPPETQARIQAQMAQAMERAQAARAAGGARGPTSPGPRSAPPITVTAAGGVTCSACHATNSPDRKFCGECGQPLPVRRSCGRCGKEAAPGTKFCGNCGGPLT